MNTPAHAIVNLLLFRKKTRESQTLAIVTGALAPDVPMVVFYIWSRLAGRTEQVIWRHDYFDPGWQSVFDAFHSFPVLGLAWLAAWRAGWSSTCAFFGSMFLHACFDFPVHHADAHRHFLPLSDWRFLSPISYWDPAWHGQVVGAIEFLSVLAGGAWLLKTAGGGPLRLGTSLMLFLYLVYWGTAAALWM